MSNFPWLSLIVLSPLLAAVVLLFVPAASRGTVRVLSLAQTSRRHEKPCPVTPTAR